MKSFMEFIFEYPVSDIRYFESLPDDVIPKRVMAAVKRFGMQGIVHFKQLTNKIFHSSREREHNLIGMIPNDREENYFHEFGHVLFDNSDKEKIKPLLDRVREECKADDPGSRIKEIELGGYDYGYSHSGPQYEYDELFAITFAFVVGDKGKFDDPKLQDDYEAMLKTLEPSVS